MFKTNISLRDVPDMELVRMARFAVALAIADLLFHNKLVTTPKDDGDVDDVTSTLMVTSRHLAMRRRAVNSQSSVSCRLRGCCRCRSAGWSASKKTPPASRAVTARRL